MGELRDAFTREHALQCGFCTPGMLIAARDIVLRLPDADERRIREEMSGNLCRCTGYVGIVNAVASVLGKQQPARRSVRFGAATPYRRTGPANIRACRLASHKRSTAAPPMVDKTVAPATARDERPRQGWTRFEQSFVIRQSRARVWELFGDIPRVAACLPGAQVLSYDDGVAKGRMITKLGPIAASFAGSAVIARDAATWSGTIVGAGSDSGSGSRTKGEIAYRLESHDQDAATRVEVVVLYNLQGALAQFSRSGLAQEFARHLVDQFAANIGAQFGGNGVIPSEAAGSSLNVGRLMWSVAKGWFRRVFSRSG